MQLLIDNDFKNLLPELSVEEYTGLEKDIVKHGILNPIILWNGTIVDGHNRYAIAQAHHIQTIPTKDIEFPSKAAAMRWILDHQLNRRNLLKSQIIKALATVEAELAKEAKERMLSGKRQVSNPGENFPQGCGEKTRMPKVAEQMAEKIGVSDKTYKDMKLIVNEGTPEQIERMDTGGKGNGVRTIANEIREKPKTKKICTICGRELPIDNFVKNRNICKSCRGNQMGENRGKYLVDVHGDIIRGTGEFDEVSDEEIMAGIYSQEEVKIGIDDVIEEFRTNFKTYTNNLKRILETNTDLISQNKYKVKAMIEDVETLFHIMFVNYIGEEQS